MRLSTEPLEAMGNIVVRLFLATELCQGRCYLIFQCAKMVDNKRPMRGSGI